MVAFVVAEESAVVLSGFRFSVVAVAKFMKKLENSQSSLLGNATNGYHYHLIEAPSEEILDNIEQKLDETGFLVPWQEWEK